MNKYYICSIFLRANWFFYIFVLVPMNNNNNNYLVYHPSLFHLKFIKLIVELIDCSCAIVTWGSGWARWALKMYVKISPNLQLIRKCWPNNQINFLLLRWLLNFLNIVNSQTYRTGLKKNVAFEIAKQIQTANLCIVTSLSRQSFFT